MWGKRRERGKEKRGDKEDRRSEDELQRSEQRRNDLCIHIQLTSKECLVATSQAKNTCI